MSYNELIALIDACVNRNGVHAITGRIMNGVLKAMVNQLGAGFVLGGVAHPADDPGTPEAPVCYFASEEGTYTNFGGLTIAAGEFALFCYDLTDGWYKETIYEGITEINASIDDEVGTPEVYVEYQNGVLSFDFRNMKGETGDPAGFGNISADVDANIGTPSVTVSSSGPDTAKVLAFHFKNLKGETGVTSVVATVDNTSGNPTCAVSLNGQELHLDFTGLKGAQGDTGVSADYPIAIVNNLTTNDPAQALSAAMGVQLESEVSQLEAEVTEKIGGLTSPSLSLEQGGISSSTGADTSSTTRIRTENFIKAERIKITTSGNRVYVMGYKEDGTYVSAQGWLSTSQEVAINGAEKYRLVFAYSNDASIVPSDFASLGITINGIFEEKFAEKTELGMWDSFFTTPVPTITVNKQSASIDFVFSSNPRIITENGGCAFLFPQNTTFPHTLSVSSYDIVCVLKSKFTPVNYGSATPYLTGSDIVLKSYTVAVDLKDYVVIGGCNDVKVLPFGAIWNTLNVKMWQDFPTVQANIETVASNLSDTRDDLDAAEDKLDKVANLWFSAISPTPVLSTGFWRGTDTVKTGTIRKDTSSVVYCSLAAPVKNGDTIEFRASLNNIVPTYFITDAGGTILSYGMYSTNAVHTILVSGVNAAYIYFNCDGTYRNKFYALNNSTPIGRVMDIDSSVRKLFPKSSVVISPMLNGKCPNFANAYRGKNQDVNVVITGTSLSQGNLYASDRDDAMERPPLLHTNDLASHIFDTLIKGWDGQKYRRYDHSVLTYTGDWYIGNNLKRFTFSSGASASGNIIVTIQGTAYQVAVTAGMTISQVCDAIISATSAAPCALTKGNDYLDFLGVSVGSVSLAISVDGNGTGVSGELTLVWDDGGPYKNPLTKSTVSSGASVSVEIPSDAWRFNFAYKTDTEGGQCTIAITEGDGKVEVYNGSAWVEANGYQFSMLEPAETSTKGNTCYQKRLNLRCKNKASGGINSIGTAKTITITKAADSSRMNVVGFEWSPREFMLTVINGARGSHQWGQGNRENHNLEYFQDSDIWEFHPTLLLAEITIINWGGGFVDGVNKDPLLYVNYTKKAYFNELSGVDDQSSLYEKSNHWTDCDVVFYEDTVGSSGPFNEDYTPKFGTVTTPASPSDTSNVGKVKTVFENYDAVRSYMDTKNYIYVPVIGEFKRIAEEFYGSYRQGFLASDKQGATLSCDGTHFNDNGAELIGILITTLFVGI